MNTRQSNPIMEFQYFEQKERCFTIAVCHPFTLKCQERNPLPLLNSRELGTYRVFYGFDAKVVETSHAVEHYLDGLDENLKINILSQVFVGGSEMSV